MAGLIRAALRVAGHDPILASEFRSFEGKGDPTAQAVIRARAQLELRRALAQLERKKPAIWFTYHLYYKAPDWLGPEIARRLEIPYVVAEPAHAPKRAGGAWASGHAAVEDALRRADAALCLTTLDRACVAPLLRSPDRLFDLPPFLDSRLYASAGSERARHRRDLAVELGLSFDKHWLLAVGMMREGPKLASFRELAAATALLPGEDWRLVVVGDGPARAHVAAAFAGDARVVFAGRRDEADLRRFYAAADVAVWPAVHEAYGMALLEAAAAGTPVVAGRVRGVPDVIVDGVTGFLAEPSSPEDLARKIRDLLDDDELRTMLGRQAAAFVARERNLDAAAERLDVALARARRR
jgi:glycosyltransferase involved in cell wall biosynthesis